eukprot:PLAT3782.2.p1 GENE.PLAT3782.2~~PLAT3782.2.p1  ORF type:complete len:570 (+),score=180.40 PLAT3782.2:181-1890(+)
MMRMRAKRARALPWPARPPLSSASKFLCLPDELLRACASFLDCYSVLSYMCSCKLLHAAAFQSCKKLQAAGSQLRTLPRLASAFSEAEQLVLSGRRARMTAQQLHCIRRFSCLQKLVFHGNQLPVFALHLLCPLAPALTDLCLTRVQWLASDRGGEPLAALPRFFALRRLAVTSIAVTHDGLRCMSKLKRCRSLDISYTKGYLPDHLCVLLLLPALEQLRLDDCLLDDTFVHRLVTLKPELRVLHLANAVGITAIGLSALPGLSQLTALSLNGQNALSEAAAVFSALPPTLTSLSLAKCYRVQRLPAFPQLTALTALDVSSTAVDTAAEDLCQQLTQLTRLQQLRLHCCAAFDDRAAAAVSLCHSLSALDVAYSAVGDAGAAAIARGCPQLQSVNFMACVALTDAAVVAIAAHCAALRELNVRGCSLVTDVSPLCLLEKLSWLELTACVNIDEEAVETLSLVRSLSYLGLNGCKAVGDDAIAAIARLPRLHSLGLSDTAITDAALTALASDAKVLRSLQLRNVAAVSADGLAQLLQLAGLTELDVAHCHLTPSLRKALAEAPSLDNLTL